MSSEPVIIIIFLIMTTDYNCTTYFPVSKSEGLCDLQLIYQTIISTENFELQFDHTTIRGQGREL